MNARTRLWTLGVAVICAGVVLLGVVGGLMPQLTQAGSSYRILQDTRDRNEGMRSQIQELEAAETNIAELEAQYETMTAAIPAEADTSSLLRELQSLQEATGARVVDLALQGAEAVEATGSGANAPTANGENNANGANGAPPAGEGAGVTIDRIPLVLRLEGSPQQISAFVAALQSGERLVLADEFQLVATPDLSNGTVIGAVFTIGGE